MADMQTSGLLQYIRGFVVTRYSERLTDRELLRRFVQYQDERAFTALVYRHGPMVLRVGRRLLRHEQDAEDVFQATFLVLASKADSTRWKPSIGNWLYCVAHRLALETRKRISRRHNRDARTVPKQASDPLDEVSVREAQEILDEELSRLPDKFRAPLVLCCLEGLSRDEAARRLELPSSLVKSRLEQARQRLSARLSRRGLTLSATLPATLLPERTAPASLPPALTNATIRTAIAFKTGMPTTMLSASVTTLAEGSLEAGSAMKLKLAWVSLLLACLSGASVIAWQAPTERTTSLREQDEAPPTIPILREPSTPTPTQRTDRYGDQLPPGAIRRLGTVRYRHGSPIAEVRFSTDGKTLISRGWYQSVSFWNPGTGKELRRVVVEPEQRLIALSPDGKLLASCKEKGAPICLRDVATGKVLRQLTGNPGSVLKAAFSPDGQILVATGKDLALGFWKVATGEELYRKAGQPGPFMALAFAPDGKILVSARSDGTVCLWEPATGRELRTLEKQGELANALAFSPDGNLLAWGSSIMENGQITDKGRIILWDMTEHKEVRRLTGQLKVIGGLAFSPNGKYLVSGGGRANGNIQLWDIATGREAWQTTAHGHMVVAFAFSPDGQTLASGSADGTVGVWDVATGKDLRPSTQGHLAAVNGLALSPDGGILASGSWDRTIRLWNPLTGEELRRLAGHTDTVFRLAFTPDGKLLASAGFDGSIRLWDPSTGKELHCLLGHEGRLYAHAHAVGFSPDGRTLASCGSDGTVRLWDSATGKQLVLLKGPPSGMRDVIFSPDGSLLAGAASDRLVYVWELSSKKQLQLRGHEHPLVNCVAFSPDGRTLASGSDDRTIRLWDAKTGEQRGRLTGHEALVASLAFTADGRTLVSTSYDQTIRLWELASGKERRQLRVDRGWPRTVVIAPDNRTLYTSGDDSTLLLWSLHDLASCEMSPAKKLTPNQERALWADLKSMDAHQAFRAESALIAIPEQAVALLRERLRPAVSPDAKRLDRLLTDLDSDEFAVRAKAEAELEALDDLAEPVLRKALEGRPSLEVRRRVDGLLKRLERTVSDPEKMRLLRALEVLEHIGTSEAAEVLQKMTLGPPGSRITRESKASFQRLTQRRPMKP